MKAYVIVMEPFTSGGRTFAPFQHYTLTAVDTVENPDSCDSCAYVKRYTFTASGTSYYGYGDNMVESDEAPVTDNPAKDRATNFQDETVDYFTAVRENMGIDIKESYAPQHEVHRNSRLARRVRHRGSTE